MSTILDALKRSEQERKVNKVPTLSDMPAPQERSRWPLMVIIVLLFIIAALFIWLFVSSQTGESETQAVVLSEEVLDETLVDNAVTTQSSVQVDVITYSQEPSARFIIVAGKMFREGEFVMAGVKVEEIQQDSVILIERGKRITTRP